MICRLVAQILCKTDNVLLGTGRKAASSAFSETSLTSRRARIIYCYTLEVMILSFMACGFTLHYSMTELKRTAFLHPFGKLSKASN